MCSTKYKETTISWVQNAVWGCVVVLASSYTKPTCISEDWHQAGKVEDIGKINVTIIIEIMFFLTNVVLIK